MKIFGWGQSPEATIEMPVSWAIIDPSTGLLLLQITWRMEVLFYRDLRFATIAEVTVTAGLFQSNSSVINPFQSAR
jgi:hypothetical protein